MRKEGIYTLFETLSFFTMRPNRESEYDLNKKKRAK